MAKVEDLDYKVVVGGVGGVGKSSLVIQLITGQLAYHRTVYNPIIEDTYRKEVVIDEKNAHLDILDTSGKEQFSAMQDQWMKDGKGFLLVYSITSKKTFNEVSAMHDKILLVKDMDSVPCVLVGNQCDLENKRQVTKEEGEKLASQWGCPFYETSATEKINHEICFYDVVREIRKHEKTEEKDTDPSFAKKYCMIL